MCDPHTVEQLLQLLYIYGHGLWMYLEDPNFIMPAFGERFRGMCLSSMFLSVFESSSAKDSKSMRYIKGHNVGLNVASLPLSFEAFLFGSNQQGYVLSSCFLKSVCKFIIIRFYLCLGT